VTRPPILPPLRRTAADAETFARAVHAGQVDQAGEPYVGHLERVARRALEITCQSGMRLRLPEVADVEQIAWLHDTIEGQGVTAGDLLAEGFAPAVVEGVAWLTKRKGEPYSYWIDRMCAAAPLPVLIVKLADMEDNADPARLALLPEEKRARLTAKYARPLEALRAAVGN